MTFLKHKNPDLIIITEAKTSKEVEATIRNEWEGEVFFNSFSSQARGVVIFKKKNFPLKILNKHTDDEGNILALLTEYEQKRILSTKLYEVK